jgi:steroid delta-isomerase-like uncharacterized protein
MGVNADIARRFYDEVWNQRREATIDELITADMVGRMEGADVTGPAEFKAVRHEMLQAFPDLRMTVEDVLEDGDRVTVRWAVQGTHTGALAGIAATGRAVEARGLTWLEFRGGRIVRGWDSWNLGGLILSLRDGSA